MQQRDTDAEAAHRDGSANGQFPYGIDPREYGMGKLDYQRALDHHRTMQHYDIKAEQHEDWRLQQAQIDADRERRKAWLEPLTAFCACAGFIFWCWFGYAVLFHFLPNMAKIADQRSAQECLIDIAKCEAMAGPTWKKGS